MKKNLHIKKVEEFLLSERFEFCSYPQNEGIVGKLEQKLISHTVSIQRTTKICNYNDSTYSLIKCHPDNTEGYNTDLQYSEKVRIVLLDTYKTDARLQ